MRLIDADILLGYVNKYDRGQPVGKALRAMLEKSPTVDAVPVIRCRDCEDWTDADTEHIAGYCHRKEVEEITFSFEYCCWAERKDNDTR